MGAFSADGGRNGRFRIGVLKINGNQWKVKSKKCTPGIIEKTKSKYYSVDTIKQQTTCWEMALEAVEDRPLWNRDRYFRAKSGSRASEELNTLMEWVKNDMTGEWDDGDQNE